jgi:TRAP-type C4-dicarboxylate transport system substrate-binding protein
MMFRSLDEVDYVREKMAPELTRRFQEKGFVVLCWGDAGWVHFFSKNPLVHPADLKRMKIFSWDGDTNQEAVWRSGGFRPVPLDMSNVLPGLQTGLIDAIAIIPFQALAGQFYTSARHMLAINWVPLAGGVVITKKAWDALPPATQQALLQAGREASEEIKSKSRTESEQAVEAMKKRGLTVHPATPELEAEWRKEVELFYPQIRGRMVPAEKFDEVRRLLQEYRAQKGSKP